MPFGLKTAPSLFQKVMTIIFSLILHTALIYIDDILLFSPTKEAYKDLLTQFAYLVLKYGIVLFEKKMIMSKKEIEFLGMRLHDSKNEA